ncbi:cytidine deaminase [Ascobolus immersus RN42]|uniref:Cytidine deaminase n=1 Tax=Ascobolus immersus RN42 TaxID=1160509 RepID=A0A3N4HFK9_ASCIM|nr:cytidine deaminase [Ascobolus immersus RN42]
MAAPRSHSDSLQTPELDLLRTHSLEARNSSYSPYSNFRVGAAILHPDGSITTGANIENASYPVGICAERVAITRAVMEGKVRAVGAKEEDAKFGGLGTGIKALGVAVDTEGASPCGMCRQFIREFMPLDGEIIMFGNDGEYKVATLQELLPLSFGPDSLPSSDEMLQIRRQQ